MQCVCVCVCGWVCGCGCGCGCACVWVGVWVWVGVRVCVREVCVKVYSSHTTIDMCSVLGVLSCVCMYPAGGT